MSELRVGVTTRRVSPAQVDVILASVDCPFDCLTCSSNATCLSCNTSDFRVLSNSRCVPEPGYY